MRKQMAQNVAQCQHSCVNHTYFTLKYLLMTFTMGSDVDVFNEKKKYMFPNLNPLGTKNSQMFLI